MAGIDVYTQALCGYCTAATSLLSKKGAAFREINVTLSPQKRSEMMARANGGRTTPQIFIGDTHVGGCDDLFALEQAGKLDALLEAVKA